MILLLVLSLFQAVIQQSLKLSSRVLHDLLGSWLLNYIVAPYE